MSNGWKYYRHMEIDDSLDHAPMIQSMAVLARLSTHIFLSHHSTERLSIMIQRIRGNLYIEVTCTPDVLHVDVLSYIVTFSVIHVEVMFIPQT